MRELLEERLANAITLDELAAAADLSRFHLIRESWALATVPGCELSSNTTSI